MWIRLLARGPAVVGSLFLAFVLMATAMVEVLPAGVGVTAAAITVAGYALIGLRWRHAPSEAAAVALLAGGRPLTAAEAEMVAPALRLIQARGLTVPRLYVRQTRDGRGPVPVGEGAVVLPAGFLQARGLGHGDDLGVAVVIAHAFAQGDALAFGWDLPFRWWALPGALVYRLLARAARVRGVRVLFKFVAAVGWLYGIVAVVETIAQGIPELGALVAMIVTLAYASPWAYKRWQHDAALAADLVIARAGWGETWTRILTQWQIPDVLERAWRIHHAQLEDAAPRPTPGLRSIKSL